MIITNESKVFQKLLKDVEYIKQALTFAGKYYAGCDPIEPIEPTPKFKVGDWAKIIYNNPVFPDKDLLVRITEVPASGLLSYAQDGKNGVQGQIGSQYLKPATRKEIESYLIGKAKERGYVRGRKVSQVPGFVSGICGDEDKLFYYSDEDVLRYYGGSSLIIYCKGTWASIVPDKKPLPKTKKELLKFMDDYHNSDWIFTRFLDEYED